MARTRKVHKDLRSRRFTDEQRQHALALVASGMTQQKAAKTIGTTVNSIWLWRKAATNNGTMPVVPGSKTKRSGVQSKGVPPGEDDGRRAEEARKATQASSKSPYAPADPAHGVSDPEVAAILECKTKHLSMGPAQIRSQLKRFTGWRLSIKAIERVLRAHGYSS